MQVAFTPSTVDEVATSRVKVDELKRHLANNHGRVLLAYGPSGCGKTTTLRLLGDEGGTAHVLYAVEADVSTLNSFIHKALSASPDETYIVKGLPDSSYSMERLRVLQQVLRSLAADISVRSTSHSRIVFVATIHDSHNDKLSLFQQYSSEFVNHYAVRLCHLPAATETRISKCLMQAIPGRRTRDQLKPIIKHIAATCRGDIRQAMLQMAWLLLVPPPGVVDSPKQTRSAGTRKRGRQPTAASIIDLLDDSGDDAPNSEVQPEPSGLSAVASMVRDSAMDIGHATGRMLCQRYTAQEVLQHLTASEDRLLGFCWNNMHLYFGADATGATEKTPIERYADVCERITCSDRLATVNPLVGLEIFDRAQKAFNSSPTVPKTFTPLGAPAMVQYFDVSAFAPLREAQGSTSFREDLVLDVAPMMKFVCFAASTPAAAQAASSAPSRVLAPPKPEPERRPKRTLLSLNSSGLTKPPGEPRKVFPADSLLAADQYWNWCQTLNPRRHKAAPRPAVEGLLSTLRQGVEVEKAAGLSTKWGSPVDDPIEEFDD